MAALLTGVSQAIRQTVGSKVPVVSRPTGQMKACNVV